MKYYAVKKGRTTGIFTTWPEAEKQVKGYPNAKFKSFKTQSEATQYLNGELAEPSHKPAKARHAVTKPTKKLPSATDDDIILYTDGGSRNHGNVKGGHVKASDKAAWAYLIVTVDNRFSDSGGELGATNNRMEIMALYKALAYLNAHQLQDNHIHAVLDSKYVLNAINQHWLNGWQRRGWTRSGGQKLENKELWQALAGELRHFSHLELYWTKGHADNEGNVFVDKLLNKTMDKMTTKAPRITGHQPTSKPVAKSAAPKTPSTNQPKANHGTKESVQAIENNLKQLGLFDDND
ncbi:ribonuclease H family protein [Lentilactobacillus kisonensis]|nr:ribonuclease H family protein [Lentilactobacillus kisonensis]